MSVSQKWAVPREGLVVRFPTSMIILPKLGGWVDWEGVNGKYWRKREIQNDVVVYDSPPSIECCILDKPPTSVEGSNQINKNSSIEGVTLTSGLKVRRDTT